MVVAAWLGRVGLGLQLRRVGVVERLASEEGGACLVGRNFGGRDQPVDGWTGWIEWVRGRLAGGALEQRSSVRLCAGGGRGARGLGDGRRAAA